MHREPQSLFFRQTLKGLPRVFVQTLVEFANCDHPGTGCAQLKSSDEIHCGERSGDNAAAGMEAMFTLPLVEAAWTSSLTRFASKLGLLTKPRVENVDSP